MKESYIYGLLTNGQTIIGKINESELDGTNVGRVMDPANVVVQGVPVVNPITGQADPSKVQIGVACILLPVPWIFRRSVTELAYPTDETPLVVTYLSVLEQQKKSLLRKAN